MQLGGLVYTGSGRKQSEPQTWGVSQSSGRGGPRRQEVRMEHGVAVAGARFSGLGVPVLGMGVAGQSRSSLPARRGLTASCRGCVFWVSHFLAGSDRPHRGLPFPPAPLSLGGLEFLKLNQLLPPQLPQLIPSPSAWGG